MTSSLPYTALNGNATSGALTTMNHPSGIALNAKGELWVANTLGDTLLRFSVFGGNVKPSATIAGNAPTAVAVVSGGTTLLGVGPYAATSFNEATGTTLLDLGLRASLTSQIAVDLAGTAWFANDSGGRYYGFQYPYSTPNGYFNVSGGTLTSPADIAVYP
jgi:streptogramin lyase